MKKKVFCIIGRSSSGKTTITKQIANKLNFKVLMSYTTRPKEPRDEKNPDHIFISKDEVDKYKKDIIAYTVINGNEYFATKTQLMESDLYIVDPIGYYTLLEKTKDLDIELIPIYITVSKSVGIERAKKRGQDVSVFLQRYDDENEEFTTFEKSEHMWYRILNHGTLEESVFKMERIIKKHFEEQ